MYMLGSASKLICCDGSLSLDSDGKLGQYGSIHIPDDLLENYPKRHIEMEEGGV